MIVSHLLCDFLPLWAPRHSTALSLRSSAPTSNTRKPDLKESGFLRLQESEKQRQKVLGKKLKNIPESHLHAFMMTLQAVLPQQSRALSLRILLEKKPMSPKST
ncbi:MAG: hypothetical protein JJW02_03580 [Pseudoalteromonas sp.]|nr:hypothetical protein [Pseudoalteromonas sp.]